MKWILVAALVAVSFGGVEAVQAKSAKVRAPASAEEKSSITDTVKKIRDDDEGVVILFAKNAGSYYLRRDVADFEASRKKLEESFKNKKPVSVTFDSAQLNILEVK